MLDLFSIEHLSRKLAIRLGGLLSGAYLSTDSPLTGASANLMVLRMVVSKTRSPKLLLSTSTASRPCTVRPSYMVGTIPAMCTAGFRFSAHQLEGAFELRQSAQRQVLALHGDDDRV